MDFSFSPEQNMLRESLQRLLAQGYGFPVRQSIVASPEGWSKAIWSQFGDLGLWALPFSEYEGGFGGKPSDIVAVAELFGRFLVVEPFYGALLLGGKAMALGGPRIAPHLGRVISGETMIALAHEERYGVGKLAAMTSRITRESDGDLSLSGEKRLVLHGSASEYLVVSARLDDRLALVLLDPLAPGVTFTSYRTIDGRLASDVRLDAVAISADSILLDDAEPALNAILDVAILALAAEAAGAVQVLVETCSAYAAARRQFGVPIGSFQAIAHRIADMEIASAKLQALLLYTTALADAWKATRRDFALLKAQAGAVGRFVGESAIQIHGGIGMTEELPVGHYLKRLISIEYMSGDSNFHLREIGKIQDNIF